MGGLRKCVLGIVAAVAMLSFNQSANAQALSVNETITLNASPADVWAVVGGFGSLHKWHPWFVATTLSNEDDGLHRMIATGDGTWFYEKLEGYSRSDMTLSYSIVDTEVPIKNYLSTVKVTSSGGGSTIAWSSTFDANGMPDDDLVKLIIDAYQAGFQSVSDMVGG